MEKTGCGPVFPKKAIKTGPDLQSLLIPHLPTYPYLLLNPYLPLNPYLLLINPQPLHHHYH
jgi:hypothetical protein